jgi:hypothetical protein
MPKDPFNLRFGTSNCVLGALLLIDEADLRLKEHVKKLCLYVQVAKVRTEVDTFGKGERLRMLASEESLCHLRSGKRRKHNTILMSFINNVCKALRGMIVIMTKAVHLLYK